jgi:hypothetical protein
MHSNNNSVLDYLIKIDDEDEYNDCNGPDKINLDTCFIPCHWYYFSFYY